MSYVNVLAAGNDHTIWLKGLEFYRDELLILQKRIQEIASKNSATDVMAGVEHFQNQFMIQQKNINDLKHKVRNYIKGIANDVKIHDGQIDEAYLVEAKTLKVEYEWIEKIMNGLRRELKLFLDKWM